MQHENLATSSIEREPIPLLPAQVGGFRSYPTDTGITRDHDVIEAPLTVRPNLRASSALAMMRDASTSAALVTNALRDGRYERVVGLVTSKKLQHELLARWEPEIVVGDEMDPWEDVSIVNAASVRSLTAHQLYAMFRGTGLSHVVVVENFEGSYSYVIGLLSRAALATRLGHLVQDSRHPPEVDAWETARYVRH
jgi:CBS domain-containing protein